MYYKNIDLSSNEINALILSGAGTLGILYLGLIKAMFEYGMISTINKYYGISSGSIIVLLLNLGYTYDELEHILLNEINIEKLININSKSLLNIFDKFAISDSTYIEDTLKELIERKGFNPFINFKQLYNITSKELNIGFVKCFQNEFTNANHITRPDMPVWLAIRSSISIPFVFQPVIDATSGFDFLVDGGILKNNTIDTYITNLINTSSNTTSSNTTSSNNDKSIQVPENLICFNTSNTMVTDASNTMVTDASNTIVTDASNIIVTDDNTSNTMVRDVSNTMVIDASNIMVIDVSNVLDNNKKKYNYNFISAELSTDNVNKILFNSLSDLNKMSFQDFTVSIISKLFVVQKHYNSIYDDFIYRINKPNININLFNMNNTKDELVEILNDSYNQSITYIENRLKIK